MEVAAQSPTYPTSRSTSGVTIPSCDGGSFTRTSIPIPEAWSLEQQVVVK